MAKFWEALFGKPERQQSMSTLNAGQQALQNQLIQAMQGQGAGGAYGQTADYYRGLMGGDEDQAFMAPEMRQFQEETIPGLAEQFAGMGSGGMSSSGFRNSAVQAGSGLQERLAAIRGGLRMQGAQGMQQMGQQGLQSTQENMLRPATNGLLGNALSGFAGSFGGSFGKNLGRGM